MSNLWFNIRFGCYHWQLGPTTAGVYYNSYHIGNAKWFEVYTFFGMEIN